MGIQWKMKSKNALFIMIIPFVSACYYDNGSDLYPDDQINCEKDNLTYDVQIQPLFDKSCTTTGCHDGTQLPDLFTYKGIMDNLERVRIRTLVEKTMPPSGPLSDCELTQLTAWIANGSPEK